MVKHFRKLLLILAGLGLVVAYCSAQNIFATLTGTVKDQSGQVVSGAQVTALNKDTNLKRTVTSDSRGDYVISNLPVGVYNISVSAQGFKEELHSGVTLHVDQSAREDFNLQVGAIAQQVEVVGTAPVVQSETSSITQSINNTQVVQLPLNGRNFLNLALISAGVTTTTQADPEAGNPAQQIAFSTTGVRSTMTSYLVDGINNTDDATDFIVVKPSIDSIQEFRVETNSYSAEFGRYSGGQINLTTKSGSNKLHGSLYDFFRDQNMAAENYFQLPNLPAPFQRNQFGGTLGGPIYKNKLFFFFGFEGLRLKQALTNKVTVPTNAELQCIKQSAAFCDFSAITTQLVNPVTKAPFAGNQIPAGMISPIGKALALYYPSPDLPGSTSNYLASPVQTQSDNTYNARVDYQISQNDLLFGRYIYGNTDLGVPYPVNIATTTTPLLPVSGVYDLDQSHSFVLDETHIFSSNKLNDFKLYFTRAALGVAWQNSANVLTGIGITGLDPLAYTIGGLPDVTVSGFANVGTTGTQAAPEQRYDTTYGLADNFSWTHGSHSFKFGLDFQDYDLYQSLPGFALGQFTFTGQYSNPAGSSGFGLLDLLLGYPSSTVRKNYYSSPWTYGVVATRDFFAMDDWRVTQKLTLNLGLRYEIDFPPYNKGGEQVAYDPTTKVIDVANITNPALAISTSLAKLPVTLPVPVVESAQKNLCGADYNNFAPRLGAAYRPFNDNKTVIRAGYGIFYDLPSTNSACTSTMTSEFLWFFNQSFVGNPGTQSPILSLSNPFPASQLSSSISYPAYVKNLPTPYVQEYNLDIQREIVGGTVVEISYVGSHGSELPLTVNLNQAVFGTGAASTWAPEATRRPLYPLGLQNSVTLYTDVGASRYNGLLAKIESRDVHGLTALATYTYSHSIDNGSATALGGVGDAGIQNNANLAGNFGSSDFDVRHKGTASFVYALPFGHGLWKGSDWSRPVDYLLGGWQITGILTAQTGFALTATLSGDNSLTGGGADRPNYTGGTTSKLSNPTPSDWFNTAAFTVPALGNFGNEGRGVIEGPGLVTFDAGLQKNFHVWKEGQNLEVRGEFYNLMNHPNFLNPVLTANSASFGQITAAQSPREIQVGLRYSF